MDIWLATISHDEPLISVIGAYSTEERAEEVAKRASPDDWETLYFVLDEIPDWIDGDEEELDEDQHEPVEAERLQNQPHADGDPHSAT
jgi:hypothetical protein